MFGSGYVGGRVRISIAASVMAAAVLISWLALGFWGSAGAASPHSAARAPRSAPTVPVYAGYLLCAWPSEAIGARRIGNVGFIDTTAAYLIEAFGYKPGAALRIQGRFPYARYMSFMLYGGGANAVIDGMTDQAIAPDAGSINPFRPLADRQARRRDYTLYVRQGSPPRLGRMANTLYTGPYHPVLLLYRVYAPDDGTKGPSAYGGVPEPRIAVLGGRRLGAVTALPFCARPRPARDAPRITMKAALLWRRVGQRGGGAMNADEAYLQARLDHTDGAYIVRFTAPAFADTQAGRPITGREDVRFWSICQYAMVSTKVIACLHDDEAVANPSGGITLVISTLADRPGWANRAHGVNWLPFGPERIGMLIYRQLLPRPDFRGSIARVAPGATHYQLRATLGRYLPTIQKCAPDAYAHCLKASESST